MSSKLKPILRDFPLPIVTPRLLIRPPELGDGIISNAAVVETFQELHPFMPWAKTLPSVDDTEEFVRLAAGNWITKDNYQIGLPLYLFERDTNHFIGASGFNNINWEIPSVEIGYWIRTSFAGKGYMREAVEAITRYAFREFAAKRVMITCDVANTKSANLARKLGYTLECVAKADRVNVKGEVTDSLIFAKYSE